MKEDKRTGKLAELMAIVKGLDDLGIDLSGQQNPLAAMAPILGLAGNFEEQRMRKDEAADRRETNALNRQQSQAQIESMRLNDRLAQEASGRQAAAANLEQQTGQLQLKQLEQMLMSAGPQNEAALMSKNIENALNLQQLGSALAFRNPNVPGINTDALGQLTGLPIASLLQQPQLSPEDEALRAGLMQAIAGKQ